MNCKKCGLPERSPGDDIYDKYCECKKDGGAAFPSKFKDVLGVEHIFLGMSLRDYFAAKAMQGIIATGKPLTIDGMRTDTEGISKIAYNIADKMLTVREE